jgi:CRISPR-associated protein (TIGR03986 family)
MNPRHISKIGVQDRIAKAPYNFVELPNKIVEAEPLPDIDCYHQSRYTGKIECTLTTQSPLYIRCGLSPADFKKFGEKSTNLEDLEKLSSEERSRYNKFFSDPKNLSPIIPGSSLRGMLRSLIEIASFSKIDRISDSQKLFFRAVATVPEKDSLAAEYKHFVKPEIIKAGYLRKEDNNWYIYPAKTIKDNTFVWIKESSLELSDLIKLNDTSYSPQYIDVSYSKLLLDPTDRAKRTFATDVSEPNTHPNKGTLVTSGNMKLAAKDSPRRNHCLIFEIDNSAIKLEIDRIAIQHYCSALTEFQKEFPFNKDLGFLEDNRPVFYSKPEKDNIVGFFGQSPNFRIPYSSKRNGHAATVSDFLPEELRDSSITDIADAIFGYVGKANNKKENYAGRIFISDAKTDNEDVSLKTIKPKILGSPKVTTFQHYLVQPNDTDALKKNLKHYANEAVRETVIRGHKLYWHKKNVDLEQIREKDLDKLSKAKKQLTEITPIKPGITFKFGIDFENLSKVELGALLWILSLASNKAEDLGIGKPSQHYCFSLGMGKPLGMGEVKVNYSFFLSDRQQRYSKLFGETFWNTDDLSEATHDIETFVKAFELFMLDDETGLHELDHPDGHRAARLNEVPRIEMLLAMLRCDQTPDAETTRYMTIDAKEYVNRPVLPTPLQIMNIPDTRRFISTQQNLNQATKEKTILKKSSDSPNFHIGQVIEAEVFSKRGIQITYRILATDQKFCEKEHKKSEFLKEREIVNVKIKALKSDGSIKNVKFTEDNLLLP